MPNNYDAVDCSVEMQAKKRVIDFFQGKEMVGPGEFQRGNKPLEDVHGALLEETNPLKRSASQMSTGDESWVFASAEEPGNVLPVMDEEPVPTEPLDDEEDAEGPNGSDDEEPPPEVVKATVSACGNITRSAKGVEPAEPMSLPVQVENELGGKLHLYHPDLKRSPDEKVSVRAVCGKWRCGNRVQPTKYASFHGAFNTCLLYTSPSPRD